MWASCLSGGVCTQKASLGFAPLQHSTLTIDRSIDHQKLTFFTHSLDSNQPTRLSESSDEDGARRSDSESETEDEDGEALTPALEVQILQTINSIRRKDPRIYKPEVAWFEGGGKPGGGAEAAEAADDSGQVKKEKRKTYKDVVREQVLAAARDGEEAVLDDGADSDSDDGDGGGDGDEGTKPMVYDAEQEAIRKAFLTAAVGEGDEGEEEEGHEKEKREEGLLRVRRKRKGAAGPEELLEKRIAAEVEAMVQRAADPKEKEADLFLRSFILGKKWVDPQDAESDSEEKEGEGRAPASGAVPAARDGHYGPLLAAVDDEEDAEEVERMEDFESKYNFRFEQEGGAEVVSYGRHVEVRCVELRICPSWAWRGNLLFNAWFGFDHHRLSLRSQQGSARRKDDKRKKERDAYKKRKGRSVLACVRAHTGIHPTCACSAHDTAHAAFKSTHTRGGAQAEGGGAAAAQEPEAGGDTGAPGQDSADQRRGAGQ